jgi:hypothetical protein
MLPLDILFHMVHDYNVDTSLAGRDLRVILLSISLNVDNGT